MSTLEEMMQQFIFASDSLVEDDDTEPCYGPVKITKGKYKGRIGCYDDDEGQYAVIYWGNMTAVLDACAMIKKSYITNRITTYDLVERANTLRNDIARLRCKQQFKDEFDTDYEEITKMYGEYVYVMQCLNQVYESTFYLQGEGKKKVFISHSSADKDIALLIASDLKMAKFNVWFDKWDLELGHSIPKEIGEGLDSADALIILVSKDYQESAFCRDEWEAYYMKYNTLKRPIISIILDDSTPPTILAARKYYRLANMSYYDEMMHELKRSLSKL